MRASPWIAVGGLTFALLALPLFAQNAPKTAAPAEAKLPITQVTLFNAGIGYFQREGTIDGTTRVDLKVNEEDVNDLILTLLANDPNGKSLAVTYDNKAPAEITLKAFSIDLTENPGLGSLLMQVRGEKVDITDQNGSQLSGQIVSVDSASPVTVAVATPAAPPIENVSILTDEGLQSLPLSRIKKVKFAKVELQAEFRKALEALAAARGASTKTVGVTFTGQGQRKVSVGYVADAPLWKPTYRIVLNNNKPTIQGFAAIENTTDEDWENVKVKLVSGRPVTFKMDLYDPLFVPRPVVEPELYASLRPPMYQGIVQGNLGGAFGMGGQFGGGFNGGQFQGGGNNLGFGGGQPGLPGAGVSRGFSYAYGGITRPSVRSLMAQRPNGSMEEEKERKPAAASNLAVTGVPQGGLGESFEFNVIAPVSLARFKSALVPLIDNTIEARTVSIYNPQILEAYPMKGVYLKNTTKTFFPKGPVSVFEKEEMTGQAMLPDLNPDESRLMSYAIDLDVNVRKHATAVKKEQIGYKLVNTSLTGRIRIHETTKYSIHNKSSTAKTVWVTQPIQNGWKLVAPEKPIEQTANLYRFEIAVPSKSTVELNIVETQDVDGLLPSNGPADRDGALVGVTSIPFSHDDTPIRQWIGEGKLYETNLAKTTFRYGLVNHDTKPHTVPVTGEARTGWKLIAPAPLPKGPLNKYQTEVIVPAGGTAVVVNIEEQEQNSISSLVDIPLEKLDLALKLKTLPPAVATALTRLRTMRIALRDTQAGIDDENAAIKEIKDDQTRIRANIERVPKESDAYKRYLKKFDDQESEIEDRTAKLKVHLKQLTKTKAELTEFLRDLKAG